MHIIVIIGVFIAFTFFFAHYWLNKPITFLNVDNVYPFLKKIHPLRASILQETREILGDVKNWEDWPEKELYDVDATKVGRTWKIFPLYAFGVWANKNCAKMPNLTKFVQSIPHLKLATLSKLSPGMKLNPHRGWGNHSNFVLRCHYGLIVPPNTCYVNVNGEARTHQNDQWIVFDDSETHYAENRSHTDRIVLIVDIQRPVTLPKGTSQANDTKELLEIVDYFRKTQS